MPVKKRNDAVVQSVLEQIKNEAETQSILTGEYLKNYGILRYLTPFSGIDSSKTSLLHLAVVLVIVGICWKIIS